MIALIHHVKHVESISAGDRIHVKHVESISAGDRILDVEVEGQHDQQHQHRADQSIYEELDGGVNPAGASPDADQEVHGQQHDLPEDVEEEEVQRHEGAHHAGFQEQEEGVVALHAGLDPPGSGDAEEAEQGGQEHHREGQAVHTDEVFDVKGRNPSGVFDELEALLLVDAETGAAELRKERCGDDQNGQREDQRRPAD